MAEKKNWIAGAIKKPGSLTATAKKAGKSISELCAGNVSGKTAKRCALADTLKRIRPK
jgi:hypothetical protein